MSWWEDEISAHDGYGVRPKGEQQPHRRPTSALRGQPRYLEPVDRGIGATPAAQPSYADLLERAKAEARNRLRTEMSNDGVKEDGYRDAYVIAHDMGQLRNPAAYRYGFLDAAGNDFFFGGERDAIKKAGRDVFEGRAKNFDEAYERHRRRGDEKRRSFDYRHPLQSFAAEHALSVATAPLGAGAAAGPLAAMGVGALKGAILGGIKGADTGATLGERVWNGVKGAGSGAVSGAALGGASGYFMNKLKRLFDGA